MGYQFFLPMVLHWRASRAEAPLLPHMNSVLNSETLGVKSYQCWVFNVNKRGKFTFSSRHKQWSSKSDITVMSSNTRSGSESWWEMSCRINQDSSSSSLLAEVSYLSCLLGWRRRIMLIAILTIDPCLWNRTLTKRCLETDTHARCSQSVSQTHGRIVFCLLSTQWKQKIRAFVSWNPLASKLVTSFWSVHPKIIVPCNISWPSPAMLRPDRDCAIVTDGWRPCVAS